MVRPGWPRQTITAHHRVNLGDSLTSSTRIRFSVHTPGYREHLCLGRSEEPNKPTKYAARFGEVGRSHYSFVKYERTYWHRDQHQDHTLYTLAAAPAGFRLDDRKKYEKCAKAK